MRAARQTLAVLLGILLLSLPLSSTNSPLIGVARVVGQAAINGTQLASESNVYAGDRIITGQDGNVLLVVSPREMIHLATRSRVSLRREGSRSVVAVEEGTVSFRTGGATRAKIEPYGVEIRSHDDSVAIGQVALLSRREARVSAVQGQLEVNAPDSSVVLQPGQAAMVTMNMDQAPAGAGAGAGLSATAKVIIVIVVVAGVATAIAVPVALQEEAVVSPTVP